MSSEISQVYSGINFEPGFHARLGNEPFADPRVVGLIDAHSWPPIISSRMFQYQPLIVAIDGMYLSSNKIEAQNLWWQLPSRPSNINSAGSVLIVAGDPAFFWSANTEINKLSEKERTQFFPKIDKEFNDMLSPLEYQANESIASYAATVGATLGMVTVGLAINAIGEARKQSRWSRRQFIQLGATSLFAMITGVSGLESMKATSRNDSAVNSAKAQTSEDVEHYLRSYDTATQSLLNPSHLNLLGRFRTAVLVAKLKDSIDHMDLPISTSASLVMGNGHVYDNPKEIIHSERDTEQVIINYVHRLLTLLDIIMFDKKTLLYPNLNKNKLIEEMFSFIAKTDVLKFTDPQDNDTDSFDKKINDLISLEQSFQSPRVTKALQKAL